MQVHFAAALTRGGGSPCGIASHATGNGAPVVSMSSDQESCYLCKEHLRDPVSIPCGHVFCSICLKTYWDHADHTGSYLCPECRVTYNKRPTPRRLGGSRYSAMPRDSFPPPPPSPDYNQAGPQDVGCDICIGKKYKAVKTCLMCLASYCEKHLKPHFESATFKRHKLVDEIGHLDRQICPQHQKGLELYCRTDQMCICVLCTVKEHKGHDMVSAEQERAEEQVGHTLLFCYDILRPLLERTRLHASGTFLGPIKLTSFLPLGK